MKTEVKRGHARSGTTLLCQIQRKDTDYLYINDKIQNKEDWWYGELDLHVWQSMQKTR